jgi:hypothetical protein
MTGGGAITTTEHTKTAGTADCQRTALRPMQFCSQIVNLQHQFIGRPKVQSALDKRA